jgi:hypothetical protein
MRARRTFDARGRLLGDDSTDAIDAAVQTQLDTDVASVSAAPAAAVGTPGNPLALPAMTVTGPPSVSFSWAQLLTPPYVYFLVAGLGLAAYLYRKK